MTKQKFFHTTKRAAAKQATTQRRRDGAAWGVVSKRDGRYRTRVLTTKSKHVVFKAP